MRCDGPGGSRIQDDRELWRATFVGGSIRASLEGPILDRGIGVVMQGCKKDCLSMREHYPISDSWRHVRDKVAQKMEVRERIDRAKERVDGILGVVKAERIVYLPPPQRTKNRGSAVTL
jgi:hypothetical protein